MSRTTATDTLDENPQVFLRKSPSLTVEQKVAEKNCGLTGNVHSTSNILLPPVLTQLYNKDFCVVPALSQFEKQ